MTADMLEVIEPSTGEVFEELRLTPAGELDERTARAGKAAAAWQTRSASARSGVLLAIADLIESNASELARLESRNVGKPIREARGEIAGAAATFRYYAGAIDKQTGETFAHLGGLHYTLRQPFGVVGAIVPWNFPLVLASWKVAPAIAAGNAILVKPAESTPLTALHLERFCVEAGAPEGLVQMLIGAETLGRAIVDHRGIRKLSFTGSTEVGQEIAERAGGQFKRLTLELGGKAANVIFADADLPKALDEAIDATFANAGQDCCSRSRILVQQDVYDQAVEQLTRSIDAIRIGDPLDDATEMGPLISRHQRSVALRYVEGAVASGARALVGGDEIDGPGFFMNPALITNVTPEMPIMQEEIFGPVVAIHPFRDEADAIRLANGTEYGLSTSVWTGDSGRAVRMAAAIDSGVVSINSNSSVHLNAPFGGWKSSGVGRELGMSALDAYTELKTVFHAAT